MTQIEETGASVVGEAGGYLHVGTTRKIIKAFYAVYNGLGFGIF